MELIKNNYEEPTERVGTIFHFNTLFIKHCCCCFDLFLIPRERERELWLIIPSTANSFFMVLHFMEQAWKIVSFNLKLQCCCVCWFFKEAPNSHGTITTIAHSIIIEKGSNYQYTIITTNVEASWCVERCTIMIKLYPSLNGQF